MRLDAPEVVEEVRAAFLAYETALMSNDIPAMDALFWDGLQTVRLGPGESLYGAEAIRAFRMARPGGSPPRALGEVRIHTFGPDLATVHAEFIRDGESRLGRQGQTWVRIAGRWRVVAAHISFLDQGPERAAASAG